MPDPSLRAWLEVAYFLSAVLLVPIAVIALWQLFIAKQALHATREQLKLASDSLRLAKEDLQVRSRREAVALAAEQCVKFAEQLIPRHNANIKSILSEGIEVVRWPVVNAAFDETSIAVGARAQAEKWEQEVLTKRPAGSAMMAILNDMEAFAIYFARGAADEEVAYPVVGALFCDWVEAFSPHLIKVRHEKVKGVISGPFQNVVELYSVWAARTKRKQLQLAATRINLELSGTDVPAIRHLGSDIGA